MSVLKLFTRHNNEQHTNAMAAFFPSGCAWEAVNIDTSVARAFLKGLAFTMRNCEENLQSYIEEYGIEQSDVLLTNWESALGIPDDCFDGTGTLEERRRDVLAKLASFGVQTSEDFEDLASLFGVDATVESGTISGIFPYTFPMIFYNTPKQARFTIVVKFTVEEASRFTYTFPFTFGSSGIAILECVFRKLKPANCDIIFLRV